MGNRRALYLRPERVIRGDRVVNAGRPRPLVLALRQTRYSDILTPMFEQATERELAKLPARLEAAMARELAKRDR